MRCTQAEKEIHLARNIATWTVQKAAIHNFQGLVSKFQDDVALANSLNFSEGSGGYPGVIDKGAFWPSPFWRGKKSGCIWEAMLRHAFFPGTDGKEFALYTTGYEKRSRTSSGAAQEKQERDPFIDLRRLCVTNLISFLDTAIVEKMFLPYTHFWKSFPISHPFF